MHKHFLRSKHLKKLLFSCAAFLMSWNAYSQNLWGANAIFGAADGEFQNAFVNSTNPSSYDPNSWTALTISDGNSTPGAAYWTRNLAGISQGAYINGIPVVSSPSQPNGIAIFDSDFLDNGGSAGCFGCGSSPSLHKGELISPVIDLTGYTDSLIDVTFFSYYREFDIPELSVSFSTDDGATWGTATDYRILQGDLVEGMITVELPNNTLLGVSNLTQCRLKFTFDGDYYFAIIDDVTISVRSCSILDQTVSSTTTTICPNTSANIDLGSSETGKDYYLRNDADDKIVGSSVAGTGSSIALNTGNVNSTTTYNVYGVKRSPATSGALQFTGNGGLKKVNLGTNLWDNNFVGTNQITIEAWVNRSSTGSLHTILGNYQANFPVLFRIDNDKINFLINSVSGIQSTNTIPTGTWTHVAATYDGVVMKVYINGVLEGSAPASSLFIGTTEPMKIGGGLANNTEYFPGDIADVRIWNISRSQTEIANDMNNVLIGSESGLIANYQFTEGSGTTTANSAVGNLYPGTLINAPAWVSGPTQNAVECSMEMSSTITITIQDNAPTVASAPINMSVNANATNCTAIVNYTNPTFDDDCDGTGLSGTMTAGLASGSNFPLGTTTVTFEYTDASSQMVSASFDVTVTSDLAVSAAVSSNYNGANVSCNGSMDGTATATVTGGNLPYTYLWTTGGTNSTETGLGAGSTTVTITDANGCVATSNTVVLTEPTALSASGTSTDEISGNDGTINLTVTGGTGTLSYAWTGPNSFSATTEDLTGLTAGTYDVTITDVNGCTTSTQIIVSSTVGINEFSAADFSIYPNPTKGLFTVESNFKSGNNIKVMDATGRMIIAKNNVVDKTNIDLSAMESGVYFVQISNEASSKTIKVVLEK